MIYAPSNFGNSEYSQYRKSQRYIYFLVFFDLALTTFQERSKLNINKGYDSANFDVTLKSSLTTTPKVQGLIRFHLKILRKNKFILRETEREVLA